MPRSTSLSTAPSRPRRASGGALGHAFPASVLLQTGFYHAQLLIMRDETTLSPKKVPFQNYGQTTTSTKMLGYRKVRH